MRGFGLDAMKSERGKLEFVTRDRMLVRLNKENGHRFPARLYRDKFLMYIMEVESQSL